LNRTLYPSLVKVIISLIEPLLKSCDDCNGIGESQEIITQGLVSLQKVSTGLQSLLLMFLCKHERTLRPCTAVTEEKEKVNELILQDWHITSQELIATVRMGFSALGTILRKLGYRKLCTRWVPHMLIQDHKGQRLQTCTNLLVQYKSLVDDFLGFYNASAVTAAVKKWLTQADYNFYERGIQGLVPCWRTRIECEGNYVEK
jgi:hypothetical protein